MIKVELDWDAARKHVMDNMQHDVQQHLAGLQKYRDERGSDEVKLYLPTDYFDATGYRYYSMVEDAGTSWSGDVVAAMKRLMVANIAQGILFGEVEANNAFEQWKLGHHDT